MKKTITSLNRANDTSESLRTTVPISIIKQFDLNAGDKLSWRFITKYNKLVIEVQPNTEWANRR